MADKHQVPSGESAVEPDPEQWRADVEALCLQGLGPEVSVRQLEDVNRGRGAFSVVLRAELAWPDRPSRHGDDHAARPDSVAAKLPMAGPNGRAAIESGAYRREALAYRSILPRSPVGHPRAHLVHEPGDGTASFLLDDLTGHRAVDQLDGLAPDDAAAVAEALTGFHRSWSGAEDLAGLQVRRNTVAALPAEALAAGLRCLDTRWEEEIGPDERATFARLLSVHQPLADRFRAEPAVLCHGDPRADNLVMDPADGRVILFDWQQMAVQPGEADLAWLAATSLDVAVRRSIEADLLAAVGAEPERYRLGLALPGLAVLLLAQRELPSERARRFVAVSLQRIAAALADNGTAELVA